MPNGNDDPQPYVADQIGQIEDNAPIKEKINYYLRVIKALLKNGGGGGGNASVFVGAEYVGDPVDGALWVDTDADGGSGDGGSSGGGGAVGVGNPADVPPAQPNAMDDEFSGNALDPKWDTSALFKPLYFGNGAVKVDQKDGAVNRLNWISQPVPAGDWEVRAKMWNNTRTNNFSIIGLLALAANTAALQIDLISWGDHYRVEVTRWNANGVFYDQPYSILVPPYCYLGIKKVGAELSFLLSFNGSDFFTLLKVDYAGYWMADVSKVGISFRPLLENGAIDGAVSCEWFRRVA